MEEREDNMNELDNPSCSRCNLSEGVYMSHNIMAAFLLFNSSHLELFRSEVLVIIVSRSHEDKDDLIR